MSTTPRLGIPFPDLLGDDPADVPQWMHDQAVLLDAIIAPASHGTIASRPVSTLSSPGIADRLYWATDVVPESRQDAQGIGGQMFRDNGTGWSAIGPYTSKIKLGTFVAPSVNGDVDYLGVGFQPKMVEFDFQDTGSTSAQDQSGKGATDGSFQFSMWSRGRESSGDSVSEYTNAFCIRVLSLSGSISWKAIYASFLPDGFRLTWQDTSGGGGLRVVYKAWG